MLLSRHLNELSIIKFTHILRIITYFINLCQVVEVIFATDICLIYLTDFIKSEMTNGNMVGMVFLNLQKTFDTVDHLI